MAANTCPHVLMHVNEFLYVKIQKPFDELGEADKESWQTDLFRIVPQTTYNLPRETNTIIRSVKFISF